jgi:hypothetical protein
VISSNEERSGRKEIELVSWLCEGAFEALMGGNPAKHDEMVAKALRELSNRVGRHPPRPGIYGKGSGYAV